MTAAQALALLPLLIAGGLPVVLLLALAIGRSKLAVLLLTLAGLAAGTVAAWGGGPGAVAQVTALVAVDGLARLFMGLIFLAACAVALMAYGFPGFRKTYREEFYVLLSLATVGAAVLAASTHFASLFLGLEVLSVSTYVLASYGRGSLRQVEAGMKYLVLASVSTAFLLLGMAMVYARLGTMELGQVIVLVSTAAGSGLVLLAGLALVLVGVGFKLALVPFHLWAPDVYQGASAPVAGFVATVSKGAMLALALRLFRPLGLESGPVFTLLFVLSVASMFGGNLLALRERSLKRLLAGSSVAHMGYLLVALLASGPLAPAAVAVYLAAYFPTVLAAFGAIAALSGVSREPELISEDYRGLAWRRPWVGAVLALAVLSLAGIPLTAGFVAKFYVLAAGAGAGLWALVLLLAVNSAVGLFYYARVLVTLFLRPHDEDGEPGLRQRRVPLPAGIALAGLALATLGLGLYPAPLLRLVAAWLG